jgi:serine protease Do
MKLKITIAFLAALLMAPLVPADPVGGDQLREDLNFAKAKVYPALVNISVVGQRFSGGRSRKFPAAGSGVIVSPAGHVLTNFHVAGETTRIVCTLPSRETIEAEVIAHDPLTDLSVLKLRLDKRVDSNRSIPFATVGDSDAIAVGDYVLAMGNPLTLSSSMTLGIVSNTKRVFTSFTGAELDEMDLGDGQVTGLFTRWIQHDALILPGNSGGPLVNLRGEVIGINELGGNGVGFAIPSNLAAHVLNQALTYGEVRRGWFGLSTVPVSKIGLESGALVSWVVEGGPAHKSGLRAGDVLLSFNGEPVNVLVFEEVPLLYKRMADFVAGEKVEIAYRRGGSVEGTALLEVAPLEKYLEEEEELRGWGMTVRGITSYMALALKYVDNRGVMVTGVRPGRPAAEAKPRLKQEDVILSINGKPVIDGESFFELVAEASKSEKVNIRLRRGEEDILTVIRVKDKDSDIEGGELAKAWLGIKTQVLTSDVAALLSLEKKKGFRVTQVFPGTEAARAGLKAGDVILAMNGRKLKASRVQDSEMLRRQVENLTIGTKAAFSVVRDGAEIEVTVLLEETPTSSTDVESAKEAFLEFSVREITFMDRIKYKWDEAVKGVIVGDSTGGGWANLAGLRGKDLLISIQSREIPDVKVFEEVMDEIHGNQPRYVKLFVRRGFKTVFLFVEPDWTKYEDDEEEEEK